MSKRILVIEDQEDNRRSCAICLTANGYEPTSRPTTGEEGAGSRRARAARPDPDGHPAAGTGRLRGHAPDQGQSGTAAHPNHRCHFLCAEWRRAEGASPRAATAM